MKTVWTDRSRVESHQRCNRLRFLEYHEAQTGIVPAKKPLPLAVGGSVHKGLETLLRESSTRAIAEIAQWLPFVEDSAVSDALADFATHRSALALDTTEEASLAAAISPSAAGFDAQLTATALELGMDPGDPALGELLQRQRNSATEFDAWLYAEQSALVEGLVRAYARRRLRPLLEEFEVLEVEREGDWELASWDTQEEEYPSTCDCWVDHARAVAPWSCPCKCHGIPWEPKIKTVEHSIRFMSRPDALLRSRADNSLYLLSFKTAATWDIRKARDAEHDMQGLSEGVEVEKRLGEWWNVIHQWDGLMPGASPVFMKLKHDCPPSMFTYLKELPSPPRILGIRMEYMLKGARYADKDLASRFSLNVWAQRSHLIRAYAGPDGGWCWSYDFLKDDGGTSKLYYKNWRPRAVWEAMSIKSWIDMLDASTETLSAYDSTVGAEPRPLGYHSPAQAQGYTSTHPLDDVFPAPMTVYRQDDQLRDLVEQLESQERKVAEAVALVQASADDGERRGLLNQHFAQSRRACEYPTTCAMSKICWGSEDMQRDPVGSALYKPRVANHPQERSTEVAK